MTSKTLTREDVIRAGIELNHDSKDMTEYAQIAEKIADQLGLPAPKPFERVAWARVWSNNEYSLLSSESDAYGGIESPAWRVIPVLIQEISPDDPRLKRGEGE